MLGRHSARQQGDELLQLQIAGSLHIDQLSHLYLNPGFQLAERYTVYDNYISKYIHIEC